jgi:hypothetical protein
MPVMITSSDAAFGAALSALCGWTGGGFGAGVFPRFADGSAFSRFDGGIHLFPGDAFAIPPFFAHFYGLFFELTNSRMDGGEKIRIRAIPNQLMIVVRHRDFDIVQMPFVSQNDVRFRLTLSVIEQFPYFVELSREFLRLSRR